jgi:hypothetical protein
LAVRNDGDDAVAAADDDDGGYDRPTAIITITTTVDLPKKNFGSTDSEWAVFSTSGCIGCHLMICTW